MHNIINPNEEDFEDILKKVVTSLQCPFCRKNYPSEEDFYFIPTVDSKREQIMNRIADYLLRNCCVCSIKREFQVIDIIVKE